MPRNTRMESHQWDTGLDPEIAPLFLALQWAHARSMEEMRPLLTHHKLSLAEFDVLATLRNAPVPHQLTPSQIQQEVVITSGGLTKVMLQLEARKLVERLQQKEDLRVKPIRLTAAGQAHIEVAMQAMVAATGAWVRNSLNAAERQQLGKLLRKLVDQRCDKA